MISGQFIRFAGVGAAATAVHYLTLIILVEIAMANALLASAAGYTVGAFVNYILNYHYTFGSDKPHREAMTKFFAVALVGLGLNSLIMALMTKGLELHYFVGQVIATGLVLLFNFAGNRWWTFRERADATKP